MAKREFKDRVVVVTGGASGIGLEIARKFGSVGSRVALLDMNEDEVKKRALELKGEGVDAMGSKCDVANVNECNQAIGEVIARWGGIDLLVNNAGITVRCPFLDTEISTYRKVMDINFFGSLNCTKAAIDSLIERRGMIIVTSSFAGLMPLLGRSGYAASKHALNGLFSTLRAELLGSGVHVMILCPGFTKTNLQTRALDGNGTITKHPQSKVGKESTPEIVAEAVFKGATKEKRLLLLTPVGRMTYQLYRIAPGLYERLMAKKLGSECEKG